MKNTNTRLIAAIVSLVIANSCNGYSIKAQPGTFSFTGSHSSSSASAFSHSSSSSYSYNGAVNPHDLESVEHGPTAGSAAFASAGANAAAISGTNAAAISGAQSASSGCGGATTVCGQAQDSNAIVGSSAPSVDASQYKVINTGKYTTGYAGGANKASEAVASGNYVQAASSAPSGGCTNCNGRFPGPSGSIHDYKPASSVLRRPTGAQTPLVHSVVSSGASAGAGVTYNAGHVSPSLIATFPGPSGSIYASKSIGAGAAAGAVASANSGTPSSAIPIVCSGLKSSCNGETYHPIPSESIHNGKPVVSGADAHSASDVAVTKPSQRPVAPSPSSLPGPSGSIYDSKPVIAVPSQHPVAPVVEHTAPVLPGPSGGIYVSKPVATADAGAGASFTPETPVFPGPSGSIHDSKPAASYGHGAASHTVSGSSSTSNSASYSGSGSVVANIPSSHPIVGPVCSYTPGSPNQCGSGSSSASNAASYSGSVSAVVTNIPSSHPVVGPVCSYAPGSPNKCGSGPSPALVPQPSVHPEIPVEPHHPLPPTDILPPSFTSTPAASPCSGASCGFVKEADKLTSTSVGSAAAGGSSSVTYVDSDKADAYQSLNHDQAHLSGGIIYENEDGSYRHDHQKPSTDKPSVSSDGALNIGTLIGPGTGHLPVEKDGDFKPFGTQGAFGGSAAFVKGANKKESKPFGTQGAIGGSAAVANAGASAQNSQDLLGHQVADKDFEYKPFGTQGAFGGSAAFASGGAASQSSGQQLSDKETFGTQDAFGGSAAYASRGSATQSSGHHQLSDKDYKPFGTQGAFGGSVAYSKGASNTQVSGDSQGNDSGFATGSVIVQKSDGTQVAPIESDNNGYANGASGGTVYEYNQGCSTGSCGTPGYDSGKGYATGQVLIQKGHGNTYEITNDGASNGLAGYSRHSHGSSGCSTCGNGVGFGAGGSFGLGTSGGFLNKLFGSGGLSGNVHKIGGGAGFGHSAAYSNAGSYAGAGASSFASAGSYASSY